MPIWEWITGLFKPVGDVVDNVHTSDEERLTLKAQLAAVQAAVVTRLIEYEQKVVEAKQAVLVAEASSESWLTRSWRPITMLTFLAIVVGQTISGGEIDEHMWHLLEVGIGGYIIGRSVEKTIPTVADALKSREQT